MRCQFKARTIEYTVDFDQPVFSLVQRQTDLLQACYRRCAPDFPLNLSDLQATGGATYADVVVTIRFPALRGSVEVRADRLYGRFDGLAEEEEADRSALLVRQCKEAVDEVFPDVVAIATLIGVRSWLTCEGGAQVVRETLATRQKVMFDPRAVGAEAANFTIHGQLSNAEEAWRIGFALEPSAAPEYGLYVACSATYDGQSRYKDLQEQSAHLSLMLSSILSQFGFNEERM